MANVLTSVFDRRIANEWRDARRLAACNPDVIHIGPPHPAGEATEFTVILRQTNGLISSPDGELCLKTEHTAALRFPRFFPAVPIEAYLAVAVFHPNVDPVNGFVCLWDRHSAGDTLVHAILHLRQILSWKMFNLWADHIMQPAAAAWHGSGAGDHLLPLPYAELNLPEGLGGLEVFSPESWYKRRRLS